MLDDTTTTVPLPPPPPSHCHHRRCPTSTITAVPLPLLSGRTHLLIFHFSKMSDFRDDSRVERQNQEPLKESDHEDTQRRKRQATEINVLLEVRKTVCVSVKKSDTVGNVKSMLTEKEGVSKSSQCLVFSGECLTDNMKLVDCGIQENSIVKVFVKDSMPLRLYVKPQSDDKTIVIEARPSDTIKNVKSSIMAKEGTHSGSFSLIFAGKQLAEDRTLESLDIHEESTLHMVATPKDTVSVSVKLPGGELLKIEVKLLYTISDVKTVVESVAGYPVKSLTFVYNGIGLRDSKILYSCGITEGSVLEMVNEKPVFVRAQNRFRSMQEIL